MRTAHRLLLGLGGPVMFAGANFLLSLALQQYESAHTFGVYAFAQVAIATGMGVSNGLFGTPAVTMLSGNEYDKKLVLGSFFKVNVVYCGIAAAVLFFVLTRIDVSQVDCLGLVGLGLLMWLRWFLRSMQFGLHGQAEVAASDVCYGIAAVGGLIFLVTYSGISLAHVVAVQSLSCIVAIFPIRAAMRESIGNFAPSSIKTFIDAFSRHGRWALLATIATEATANSHAYIAAIFLGPSAFAPIALATLMFRPLGVILTGLVHFERPRMAKKMRSHSIHALDSDIRPINTVLWTAWAGNLLIATTVLVCLPQFILRSGYGAAELWWALSLVAAVMLLRAMREPTTAALQVHGEFLRLSLMAVLCAPISILGIVCAISLQPNLPALTILGPLIGELTYLALVKKRYAYLGAAASASLNPT
jgi:hypothetical protein